MAGSQVLEVPPCYPAYLPRPVLRDGGLYLEPYPAMPEKTLFSIPDTDYAWVMVALQPWVMKYSPRPYDVNWAIEGWGSGKTHIAQALTGRFAGTLKMTKPVPPENFLEHPKEPTGFDKFLIGLDKLIPDIMGKLFESFLPGTGSTIRKLVGTSAGTWDPVSGPVDLSPVYQDIQNSQGGGLLPGLSGDKWPLYLGGALLLIGLFYTYDGDS